MAISPGRINQPWRTQYWRGPGSETTRARPGSTAISVVPSGPLISNCRLLRRSTSANTLPSWRMIARSAMPEQRNAGADQQRAGQDDQPVARSDQAQPGHYGQRRSGLAGMGEPGGARGQADMVGRSAAGQGAVADQHAGAIGEFAGQPFGDVDRTMLAACAADRYRQIAAVVADVGRQPGGDEMADVVAHPANLFLGFEEVDDRLVAAGQRAQCDVVMRVGQATDVEDEVGIERQAVLEAEGFEHQRQALAGLGFDELAHPLAQRIGFHAAGVDAMAEAGDRLEHLP